LKQTLPDEIVGQIIENARSLLQNPTLSKIKQKKLESDSVNYGQDTEIFIRNRSDKERDFSVT
jgi:hypothetical protein